MRDGDGDDGYDLAIMRHRLRTASVLVALASTMVIGCSDDGDADPTKPAAEPVLEVSVDDDQGTCMLVTPTLPPQVDELPLIGCELEHTHEIYQTVVAAEPGEVYPGLAALESIAQTECLTEFDRFVGISAFDSTLTYTWLLPTLDGWNDEDDREILCVLQNKDGSALVGSMKQTKR